jgi:hypothetical protein
MDLHNVYNFLRQLGTLAGRYNASLGHRWFFFFFFGFFWENRPT